jgi:hypothetical protein
LFRPFDPRTFFSQFDRACLDMKRARIELAVVLGSLSLLTFTSVSATSCYIHITSFCNHPLRLSFQLPFLLPFHHFVELVFVTNTPHSFASHPLSDDPGYRETENGQTTYLAA